MSGDDTGERELKLKVTQEGADQVIDSQKKLADGQREIADTTQQTAPATERATKSTKHAADATSDLAVKQEDLSKVLTAVHPSLGQLVESMAAASKVAGELGTKNIDLSSTIETVTDHVTKNAAMYKLLGAGGAAFAGLLAVHAKWKEIRAEIKAAADESQRLADIQAGLAGEREATRGTMADALVAAHKPGDENLASALNYAGMLARAGLGEQAVAAGAHFAGTGAERGKVLAAASAADLGLMDFNDRFADQRLDQMMANERQRQLILENAAFRGGEGPDRAAREAREQFFNAAHTKRGPLQRWWYGPNEMIAEGDPSQILGQIGKEYGLEGEEAKMALEAARKHAIDRSAKGEVRFAQVGGMFLPIPRHLRPFGERAFQRMDDEGDWQDIAPGLRGVAEQLAERMLGERERGAPGTPQEQANVRTIEHHYHRTVHNHSPRFYRSAAGNRGGRNNQNARDRSGKD